MFPDENLKEDEATWDELRAEIQECCDNFVLFMGHVIRSTHQRSVTGKIIDSLQDDEVYMIIDWKMKILLFMFRETMRKFFGKAGLSLHGCAVIMKPQGSPSMDDKDILYFDDATDDGQQDAFAVLSMLDVVFQRLKRMHPHVQIIKCIQADNAGCYVSQDIVVRLHSLARAAGLKLQHYVHTEAQNGKTCLDGHFAFVMHQIRLWAQEGNDVLTAESIFTDLSHKKISGSFPSVVQFSRKSLCRGSVWPNMRRISHVQFSSLLGIIWYWSWNLSICQVG
eukprot:Pompholyxophrys_punicea_v1_NODE_143_length_3211_cov_4.433777.p1 type:complete len:280 gc:universal NODE_143_length_3211_cov_4.433777:1594-2433(+)